MTNGRLIEPADRFRKAFPNLDFRDVFSFRTLGEPVFVTDPIYLADVYSSVDEVASLLRARGVFLMDFGGDVSCPIWWQEPYLTFPISLHLARLDLTPAPGVVVLAEEVGTDSGSFVFLPLTADVPTSVERKVAAVLAEGNGASLQLPAADWSFYYEQWEPPKPRLAALYRNIVVEVGSLGRP